MVDAARRFSASAPFLPGRIKLDALDVPEANLAEYSAHLPSKELPAVVSCAQTILYSAIQLQRLFDELRL